MARICFLTLLEFLLIPNLFIQSQTKKSKQRLTKLSENKACRANSFLQTSLCSYPSLTTNKPMSDSNLKIAHRFWSKAVPIFYVQDTPNKKGTKKSLSDGVDWGYTTDPKQAKKLNPYWQKRFAADCRRAGVEAKFI